MRLHAMTVLLLVAPVSGSAQQASNTYTIELEDAVTRALSVSPQVRIAEGEVLAAQGQRAEAIWSFTSNPTVEYDRARRRTLDREVYDYGWRLSQQVEIAGQSFLRAGAGTRRIGAAEASVADAARISGLEARLTYLELHLAERRSVLAASSAELADQLADLARRQLDAGEINVLAFNTAALEAARARAQADRFEGERRADAAQLARVLAITGDSSVTTDDLPALPELASTISEIEAPALERRPDMRAATLLVEAADKSLAAQRRRMIPNLEVALFSGEEEGTDELLGFSLGFSLPLFNRSQSDVGAARADRAASRAMSEATARMIRAQVQAGMARYASALTAERRFVDELLLAGGENAELAALAFEEGELSIADVVVFRATALATQLEYLEVLADAYAAWFELAAALNAQPGELTQLLGGE